MASGVTVAACEALLDASWQPCLARKKQLLQLALMSAKDQLKTATPEVWGPQSSVTKKAMEVLMAIEHEDQPIRPEVWNSLPNNIKGLLDTVNLLQKRLDAVDLLQQEV